MISMFDRSFCKLIAVVAGVTCLSGCYYLQAARGQLDVMNKREPIDEVIAAEDTPAELARRLELVKAARQFSIDELKLPDNDSYRSYADLERDYIVWNVIAAPEFSLEPKEWCFPVVGCISYRGYFAEDAARRKAEKLAAEGYDVAVGGVAAYSTLGRFSDPVLNTMMRWQDVDLVAVLFHELAHQELYVKDDTEFNESFATAVEEIGIERWLAARGNDSDLDYYRDGRRVGERMIELVEAARDDLQDIYAADIDATTMRSQKADRLDVLTRDLHTELQRSGRKTPDWLRDGINNARVVSMSLYTRRVPEFRALLADCSGDIECFYDKARQLAGNP